MSTNMNELNKVEKEDNHDKIQAEIAKIFVEIEKMRTENKWYPFIVGSTVTLAIVGVAKIFL